jgi:deoxyribodipyrimidine photo-lyase
MTIALAWFRQDLRLSDNSAFIDACSQHQFVIPLYIYDDKTSVLGQAQGWWLHHSLSALNDSLARRGLNLRLRKGDPLAIILDLLKNVSINAVYWNRCYEPAAISRDKTIKATLLERGIEVHSSNGSLLHEPWTVKSKSGDYFKVFTPYWKYCKQILSIQRPRHLEHYPAGVDVQSEKLSEWKLLPSVDWALQFNDYWTPGEEGAQNKLDEFIEDHLKGYKKIEIFR